jgi:hypothetical protein
MTRPTDERLLAIGIDGSYRLVPNTYEGIKLGLDGATLDFLNNGVVGLYIDDNGMLEQQPLNVVASLMVGRPIYGPVVLCGAEPDDEGDTVPPPKEAAMAAIGVCDQWQTVWGGAIALGQDLCVYPNADTIPPPQVFSFTTDAAFARWLEEQ